MISAEFAKRMVIAIKLFLCVSSFLIIQSKRKTLQDYGK